MSRHAFTRAGLAEDGFRGWVAVRELRAALRDVPPGAGGLYVVVREGGEYPMFLDASPAGRFRGDPSVAPDALAAHWIDDCQVVYIGKAKHGRLRARLRELEAFGRGTKARHWGGRLIWQLADSPDLIVAWKELPEDANALAAEATLLSEFRRVHGRAPFANDPHLD
jgi:hypothetical protein